MARETNESCFHCNAFQRESGYNIPPLIIYPLIEYSNLLTTEVVYGLCSLLKRVQL